MALLLAAASSLAAVLLYQHNLDQRAEAVRFVCDLEFAFEEFVNAEPDLPRDRIAVWRLKKLNCPRLVERTAE